MFTGADIELAAFASRHHDVFTHYEALEFLTRRQIEWRVANAWDSLHEGVYVRRGTKPTWKSRLFAATLAATAPTAIAHRAAAAVYELPGAVELVEVTCRRWKRTVSRGIIVHESTRFSELDITHSDGIPVVTPELLILQLAGLKP